MNFMKYHVSKNLFDKAWFNNDKHLSASGLPSTYTGRIATINPIDVSNIDTVTLTYSLGTTISELFMYSIFSGNTLIERVAGKTSGDIIDVTNADKLYICLYLGSNKITVNDVQWIMLNTGSTPLPYEPYSSKVWHDIPYYQHKTATDTLTLPAVIYPNDTSITVGIKGQGSQASTPTPSQPCDVNGCGERTGNLAPPLADWISGYVNANGSINNPSGTVQEKASDYLSIEPDTDYVFAFETGTFPTGASGYWSAVGLYDKNKAFIRRDAGSQPGTPRVFHTDSDAAYIRLSYRSYGSTLNTMLNSGSTPQPYEPFGYKIPISCGGTTTPVYLGEVETTRKIKKLVFEGTENVDLNTVDKNLLIVQAIYTLPKSGTTTATNIICSHLKTLGSGGATSLEQGIAMRYNGTDILFGVPFSLIGATAEDTNATIRTKLKSYLTAQYAAGTPVTVWYVLATPTTATVNEPLMKIGTYADSLTTSIPVTAGENSFDVQTTVQPSEVTVNYKGWHPVQSVHEKSRNLLPSPVADTVESAGITIESSGDGIITISGTRTSGVSPTINLKEAVTLNGTYYVHLRNNAVAPSSTIVFRNGATSIAQISLISADRIVQITLSNATIDNIQMYVTSNTSIDVQMAISIEHTESVTPYEPYWK